VTLLPFPHRGRVVDWRTLSAERMAPLYEAEADRWSRLDWDTSAQWQEVERGRQFGTISGVVVLDDSGRALGWTFYQIRNRALQVGVLDASDEAVMQVLVDRALSEQTLAFVETVTFFALSDAPGLTTALRAKGLSVDRYWYLGRELQRTAPPALSDIRRWRFEDTAATCDLLARGYKGPSDARPFAPAGRPEEWIEYVNRLTRGFGCGALLPDASLCIPSGPNRLVGLAMVTRISDSTAHLAQLVVDPQFQGRRLAVQLMELAGAAAARSGCRRMTLLVGGSNRRARSLYEAARFQAMGSFVAAGTLQPRRSTSAAPAGARITRR
jgi:ribosomal protein S18 acetylase RimI-like enzyme